MAKIVTPVCVVILEVSLVPKEGGVDFRGLTLLYEKLAFLWWSWAS